MADRLPVQWRSARRIVTCALLCLTATPVLAENTLDGVRVHQAPDHTRIVFDTSGEVAYHIFQLSGPERVVIDVADSRAGAGFSTRGLEQRSETIAEARSARRGTGWRVVFEVDHEVEPKAFRLQPVAPYGHRLVVDLYQRRLPEPVVKPVPVQQPLRDVVVAIDAGHGGDDPGASGPRGQREKLVVLQIAQKLKRRLDAEPGYEAVLVRTADYYVKLGQRVELARDARADLFLSIHADAFKSPEVSGASVYTLSENGASSETARWLAEKENRSDLIGGVGDVRLDDKDDVLAHVLLDLSMDAKRSASIEAANSILRALRGVAKLHKRRVEQAGFVVLKAPDVPSVLIETGYISNPGEALRLSQRDYQEQIARAMFDGVTEYLSRRPPPDSLLAHRVAARERKHVIERGDTLSEIAVRYGVSTQSIRRHNRLNDDRIRVGQVLIIPAG